MHFACACSVYDLSLLLNPNNRWEWMKDNRSANIISQLGKLIRRICAKTVFVACVGRVISWSEQSMLAFHVHTSCACFQNLKISVRFLKLKYEIMNIMWLRSLILHIVISNYLKIKSNDFNREILQLYIACLR